MSPVAELVAIDGTALLFRSYFGGVHYAAPDGTQMGAVMVVLQKLQRLMWTLHNQAKEKDTPLHVAMVFDAGQHTFRNDIDPSYKANRGSPPADLVPQFDAIKRCSEALGIATWSLSGFEADDLMATLAKLSSAAGMNARLLSNDKDLCQLVTDGPPAVVLEDPYSGKVTDVPGVHERLGVKPHQATDFQALVGDSTDNIAGVSGVGAKTAAALLANLGSLDGIFSQLDQVAGLSIRGARTLGDKLARGERQARLAHRLVTLDTAVDMGIDAGNIASVTQWSAPATDADQIFSRLGLSGPLNSLLRLAEQPSD